MKKSFFYVFNPQGEKPTFKHETYEQAHTEAERLASRCPETTEFYVLEARCCVKKQTTTTEVFETDSEIPF